MSMNSSLMADAMRALNSGNGVPGSLDVAQRMRDVTEETIAFQAVLTDMAKAHNNFNMLVSAKQEGMKAVADLTREGIRKSSDR